jgi:hypothetical protein
VALKRSDEIRRQEGRKEGKKQGRSRKKGEMEGGYGKE